MVIKNAILNIIFAFSNPSTIGYVANMIGTAPLNPTHETYERALSESLRNGARDAKMASGRDMKIIINAMIRPNMAISTNS